MRRVNSDLNKANIGFGERQIFVPRTIKHVSVADLKYGPDGDYYKGDILYRYSKKTDLLAEIVNYFTKGDRKSRLRSTHVGIIIDESTCLETRHTTIAMTDMKKKYLDNNKYRLYIRRPKEMTPEMAAEFVENAKKDIGTRYARVLLVATALRASLPGRVFDKATNAKYFDELFMFCKKVSSKLYRKGTLICSEHVAKNLQASKSWPLHNEGILKDYAFKINPQKMIDADELFKPTITQIR